MLKFLIWGSANGSPRYIIMLHVLSFAPPLRRDGAWPGLTKLGPRPTVCYEPLASLSHTHNYLLGLFFYPFLRHWPFQNKRPRGVMLGKGVAPNGWPRMLFRGGGGGGEGRLNSLSRMRTLNTNSTCSFPHNVRAARGSASDECTRVEPSGIAESCSCYPASFHS